jgi:hypothetical protein
VTGQYSQQGNITIASGQSSGTHRYLLHRIPTSAMAGRLPSGTYPNLFVVYADDCTDGDMSGFTVSSPSSLGGPGGPMGVNSIFDSAAVQLGHVGGGMGQPQNATAYADSGTSGTGGPGVAVHVDFNFSATTTVDIHCTFIVVVDDGGPTFADALAGLQYNSSNGTAINAEPSDVGIAFSDLMTFPGYYAYQGYQVIYIGAAATTGRPSTVVSAVSQGKVFDVGVGGTPPTNWYTTGFSDAAWSAPVAQGGSVPGAPPSGSAWLTWASGNQLLNDEWLHRISFTLPSGTIVSSSATLQFAVDDSVLEIYANGTSILSSPSGSGTHTISVPTSSLTPGATNLLAFHVKNSVGSTPTSLAYRLGLITSHAAGTFNLGPVPPFGGFSPLGNGFRGATTVVNYAMAFLPDTWTDPTSVGEVSNTGWLSGVYQSDTMGEVFANILLGPAAGGSNLVAIVG